MSTSDASRDHPAKREELATAAQGTPAPVDVAVDPRARNAIVVFLAGPLIATLYFATVYLVTEAGCSGDGPGLDIFDPPVPTVVTLAATAVASLACAAAALLAYRRWRRGPTGPAEDLVDREPLAFVGFLMSLLALVTVLMLGLPALVLPAC
jgi:hypothetical protein